MTTLYSFNYEYYKLNEETGDIQKVSDYVYGRDDISRNVKTTIAKLEQCLHERQFLERLPSHKIRAITHLANTCLDKLREFKRYRGAEAHAASDPEQVAERMVASLREYEQSANQRHAAKLREAFTYLQKYKPVDIVKAIFSKENKEIIHYYNEFVRHHGALKGSKSAFEGTDEFKAIDDFWLEVGKTRKRLQGTFQGQPKEIKKTVAQLLAPECNPFGDSRAENAENESLTAILDAYPELADQIFTKEKELFTVDPDLLLQRVLQVALRDQKGKKLPHLLDALDEPLKGIVSTNLQNVQKLDLSNTWYLDLQTMQFLRTMCPHLKELSLRSCNIGNDILVEVAKFSELQKLDISENSRIDTEGVRSLVQSREGGKTALVTCLQAIYLNDCERITDEGMVHLCRLQHVQTIHMRHSPITDVGVQALAALQLREIDMGQCPGVTDGAIRILAATTPTLEKITLSVGAESRITKTALQLLYTLAVEEKKLHTCVIGGDPKEDLLGYSRHPVENSVYVWHLNSENPQLEILECPFHREKELLDSILSTVPFGQNLLIQLFERDHGFVNQLLKLNSFNSLSGSLQEVIKNSAHAVKALSLDPSRMNPEEFNAYIPYFSNIEKLGLAYYGHEGSSPTENYLRTMNIPSTIQEINLFGHKITAEGLRYLLEKAPNLRKITLPDTIALDAKTFEILAQFPKLTELELPGNRSKAISSKDLEGLARLPHLTALTLRSWQEKSLEQVVTSLPKQLTHLSLDTYDVSNQALNALKQYEKLQFLDLSRTGIRRETLNNFPALPSLREVRIWPTWLSPAELEALRKKLPKAQVVLVKM